MRECYTPRELELLLERDENDRPLYMHARTCPGYCDYACNQNGTQEAEAIDGEEGGA